MCVISTYSFALTCMATAESCESDLQNNANSSVIFKKIMEMIVTNYFFLEFIFIPKALISTIIRIVKKLKKIKKDLEVAVV